MHPPYDSLGYSAMIHDALRSVVRKTLLQVKEFGMPTDHHFYITFKTMAPQVVLPLYLRQKYPESMTIVLQYQFHNLTITDKAFSVSLSFGGKFETLAVPFSAIVMFSDPEAQLVFNFEPLSEAGVSTEQPSAVSDKGATEKPLSTIGKKPQKSAAKTPTWHGSIALGAQTPLEPPQKKTETQSQTHNKTQGKTHNKGKLKPVATKTSAKVLTFRPKNANAPHDGESPSKTP